MLVEILNKLFDGFLFAVGFITGAFLMKLVFHIGING